MSATATAATLPDYLDRIRQECCRQLDAEPERLARWRATEPALSEIWDAATAHEQLGTPLSGRMSCAAQTDAALYALLTWASAGDRLAAQLVLSSQLPWIAACVRRHALLIGDMGESVSLYVTATLECAAAYPASRRRYVLRALHGLIAKHVARATGRVGLEIPSEDLPEAGEAAATIWGTVDHPRSQCADRALEVVAHAHDVGAITTEETEILVRSYLSDRTAREDIAADLGISSAAARRRISLAVRRLAAFTSLQIDQVAALGLLASAMEAGAMSAFEVELLVREFLQDNAPEQHHSPAMRDAIRVQVGRAIANLAAFAAASPARRPARPVAA